ncbi:MAG: PIG-L deacetylase family protein [Nitrospinota bacterium]
MAEWDRVLVVVAHPDDAELGSGGSIARWVSGGATIDYIIATNGNKGTKDLAISPHQLAETREAEQKAAAELLGARGVIYLRYNDGELQADDGLKIQLAILIRHHRPDVIVTHDPWRLYHLHPDHRALGITVTDAIVAARDHLFLPALSVIGLKAHHTPNALFAGADHPNYFVDISQTLEAKIESLARHKSQMFRVDGWQDRVRERAAEVGRKGGFEYAEGFHRIEMH